jgi:phage tail-like protein
VAVNPYLAYNYRVKWDGRYVAAVTSVSGLTRATEVATGQAAHEPVRLERGITTDSEFVEWANWFVFSAGTSQSSHPPSPNQVRKPMQIELHNQAGLLVATYLLSNCWPSEYVALPALDQDADVVAMASMTIEHEG